MKNNDDSIYNIRTLLSFSCPLSYGSGQDKRTKKESWLQRIEKILEFNRKASYNIKRATAVRLTELHCCREQTMKTSRRHESKHDMT